MGSGRASEEEEEDDDSSRGLLIDTGGTVSLEDEDDDDEDDDDPRVEEETNACCVLLLKKFSSSSSLSLRLPSIFLFLFPVWIKNERMIQGIRKMVVLNFILYSMCVLYLLLKNRKMTIFKSSSK